MGSERILIVEDDPALRRGLKDNFAFEGYDVLEAVDGQQGLDLAMSSSPDVIVLDIMLPKINGYEICRILRKRGLECPIVMLTAKGQEQDILLGLDIGADDYVTKPFSVKQLLARVSAMLRRQRQGATTSHAFGPFTLDVSSRRLLREGREIPLTPKEFGVLALLAGRPDRAMSRRDILREVWGRDVFVTLRSVDRCINTLRAKIEDDPTTPRYIHTVRPLGYRFEA
ncbi:MAG: response regulator transcription factor [Phycisphaeraceae bacterium]|nr:response regulator transcription factor [Phycisphaeraceae bacterium]